MIVNTTAAMSEAMGNPDVFRIGEISREQLTARTNRISACAAHPVDGGDEDQRVALDRAIVAVRRPPNVTTIHRTATLQEARGQPRIREVFHNIRFYSLATRFCSVFPYKF
jgi:hypothetical protein